MSNWLSSNHCGRCALEVNERWYPDHAVRERIAQELDRTLLVEASAGTGKTTCLVRRMIQLIIHGRCTVDTLAAVTFTRKAAAELRSRFQIALQEARQANLQGEQSERIANALAQIDSCFIGTIHAFCALLLRERPVEAGIDPSFRELDETGDELLKQRAWQMYVANLIATDDPILPEFQELGLKISWQTTRAHTLSEEFDQLGLEPADLGLAFMNFSRFPDIQEWPCPKVDFTLFEPTRVKLQQFIAYLRSLHLPPDPGNDKLVQRIQWVLRMTRRLMEMPRPDVMRIMEQFRLFKIGDVVQNKWPDGDSKTVLAKWNAFFQEQIAPALQQWRECRYEPVMRALSGAKETYDRLRRHQNLLNFHDLLMITARMLSGRSAVRNYFRKRFTHLLVDEFQDTDPLQAEIVLLITADDATQTQWQLCRPVPGSLFVVGDPKQSIYRFRRADIQTYNRVRRTIENSGGSTVRLTANFRSTPEVIDWINGVFDSLWCEPSDRYRPDNAPLAPGKQKEKLSDSASVLRLIVPERKSGAEMAQWEADAIARSIASSPGNDHLVIVRTGFRINRFADAMKRYDIAYSVTGSSLLNQVGELELLYLCLKAVLDHDDPIALVSLLRSELFCIPDRTLFQLRKVGGHFNYRRPLPATLDDEHAQPLRSIFERMARYANWFDRRPFVVVAEQVACDLGLLARACASREGNLLCGCLMKAFDLLRHSDSSQSQGDQLDMLGQLVACTWTHDGLAVRPTDKPRVRIMNLHQCKGLQASVVYLADPQGEKSRTIDCHIDRSEHGARGYMVVTGPAARDWAAPTILAQPLHWSEFETEERRFLDAESERLLYVAATRAERQLIVSQREKKDEENPWSKLSRKLCDAPLLSMTDLPIANGHSTEQPFNLSTWQTRVFDIEEARARICQPNYAIQALKASVLRGIKQRSSQQYGTEWGNVVHGLLDALAKHPDLDIGRMSLTWLESEGLSNDYQSNLIETIKCVVQSPVWSRSSKAKRRLTEVPIQWLDRCSPLPSVVRGVIDLVFEEADGWIIVDYKTERLTEDASGNSWDALFEYYRPQLEAYAEAWEKLTKTTVTELGVLFTHTGDYRVF